MINKDTKNSVIAVALVILCFIFFVSLSNNTLRRFTSVSLSAPALLKTISLMPFILSKKYPLKEANSSRYFTPLSFILRDKTKGKAIPIIMYPNTATIARYQLDIIPTNIITDIDTSTAIQIGDIVCA